MLLSELLKTSTANYHDEIEGKLASKKLFDGTFTDQDYYKMLQVNHLFLEVYEKDIRDLLSENDLHNFVQTNPDLADQKFNYFGHYGENLGQSWKTFVSYINEEFTNEEQQKQVLEGAKKAYEDLISFA